MYHSNMGIQLKLVTELGTSSLPSVNYIGSVAKANIQKHQEHLLHLSIHPLIFSCWTKVVLWKEVEAPSLLKRELW